MVYVQAFELYDDVTSNSNKYRGRLLYRQIPNPPFNTLSTAGWTSLEEGIPVASIPSRLSPPAIKDFDLIEFLFRIYKKYIYIYN